MTRLFFSAGLARIVVIQQNWLTAPKSTGAHTGQSATTAAPAKRG